nr:MAG TPA: hypothetical protein [Caudoviricetes sp.]
MQSSFVSLLPGRRPPRHGLFSVGRSVVKTGDGHDADHVFLHQPHCRLDGLPAHGRPLVQGIPGAGRAQLLDDHLQAAAADLGDAISVRAQDQGGINIPACGAAVARHGGAGAFILGDLLPDFGLGGLHKAAAGDLSDLAGIDVVRVHILMGISPLGVAHQVIGHIGMDNGHIVAVDGRCVHGLELAHRPADVVHGEDVVVADRGRAAHQVCLVGNAGCAVIHIGAAVEDFPGDGVQRPARLGGQQFACLHEVVVDGRQLQHIRQRHIAAILGDGGRDVGHIQLLAVGGNALGQRRQRLGQAGILAELNGLAAVLGDGPLLAELVMHQRGLRKIDQVLVVIGLHLHAQAGAGGGLRGHIGVQVAGKKICQHGEQYDFGDIHCFSFPLGSERDLLASFHPLPDLGKVSLAQLAGIALSDKSGLRRSSRLCGPLAVCADAGRHIALHLLCRRLLRRSHQLRMMHGFIGILHGHARPQHGLKGGVLRLGPQVKGPIGLLYLLRILLPLQKLLRLPALALLLLLPAMVYGHLPACRFHLSVLLDGNARLVRCGGEVFRVILQCLQRAFGVCALLQAVAACDQVQQRLIGLQLLPQASRLLEAVIDDPLALLRKLILVFSADQLQKGPLLLLRCLGLGDGALCLLLTGGVSALSLRPGCGRSLSAVKDLLCLARFLRPGAAGGCLCLAGCSCRSAGGAALSVKKVFQHGHGKKLVIHSDPPLSRGVSPPWVGSFFMLPAGCRAGGGMSKPRLRGRRILRPSREDTTSVAASPVLPHPIFQTFFIFPGKSLSPPPGSASDAAAPVA